MLKGSVTIVGLLQAAAILTVLFSVLTAFDSRQHFIELFAHFRLQYLVVSIVLLLVFALLKDRVYAVLLLVAVILNASLVVRWYFDDSLDGEGVHLKVLHANVLSTNTKYAPLLELIETEQPDVIFLQEFSPHWQEATRALQVEYPFSYAEPREGNFGIAMFSRLPLDTVRHIDSPPLSYPTIVATAAIGGEELTLISTHPTIPLGRANYDARNEQLESVAGLVQQAQGAVILVGDLNASLWDRRYLQFESDTGLRSVRRGFGILPSWPTFMPFAMIPIDHALVSEGVSVVETRTGARIGSDHLPLIVTLSM